MDNNSRIMKELKELQEAANHVCSKTSSKLSEPPKTLLSLLSSTLQLTKTFVTLNLALTML